jgi:hypothetical protein
MAIYEWICRECDIFWERDCALGKAPSRTRCPKCSKLSDRFYDNQNVGVAFGNDKDFQTVRARYKRHAEKGFDKTAGDRWLNNQIEHTKNAMNDESFRYKSANIDWDKFAKSRGLRKVGETEAKNKMERAKKLTGEAYDRANQMGYKDIGSNKLDIKKPNKQS